MYKFFFKRLLDIVISIVALLALSPVIITVMLCLFLSGNGSPFFYQARPGKGEKTFKIIKFKSMSDERDADGQLLPDKDRLTRLGAFIRKTSLDEVPQLINVLKGDMSLVGPRPLLIAYLPYYTEREKLRHSVRPGITGLAQVSGRNSVTWDEKLELDAKYAETLSFIGDVKILIQTLLKVIRRKDVSTVPSQFGVLLSFARQNECLLRPIREEDIPHRVKWLNDPRINSTMDIDTPVSIKRTFEWFSRVQENNNRADLVLVWNDRPVAMTGVSDSGGIAKGYTFVDPDMKGCGFGKLAHFLRLVYVFDVMGKDRVEAVVDGNNTASRKTVEKLGFKRQKIVKGEIEKNGKPVDRYYYSCTSGDFDRTMYGYVVAGKMIKYTHKRGAGVSAPVFPR